MLLPGIPSYSFGSFNADTPATKMLVTSVAIATNVATLGVKIVAGNIPPVGAPISVRGTQAASGAFNVSNKALTAVTIDAQTGAGTVTFALVHADVSTTPDAGQAIATVPEIGETLATSTAYRQFSTQAASGIPEQGRTVSWQTDFVTPTGASAPSAISVALQGALHDIESEYTTLDTSSSTTGDLRLITGVNFPFLRLKVVSLTGTAIGTGKIVI